MSTSNPEQPLKPEPISSEGVLAWDAVAETGDGPAAPADAAELLILEEFLTAEPTGTVRRRSPPGPPGPGLPEACGWAVGVLGAQLACAIVVAVAGVVWLLAPDIAAGKPIDTRSLSQMETRYFAEFMGGIDILFVPLTVAAAALRLLPAPAERLGLRPLAPLHLAVTVLITIPLSVVSTVLYFTVDLVWQQVIHLSPELGGLDELSSVALVQKMAETASFPYLILIIAVAPAIAEEVIFRGVIGRGLVARWGVVTGVLMTSVLFGLVHVHPVHALAVIPLGIAMHVLHLETRSFWAPVLLHFLNNAWATFATKFPELVGHASEEEWLPPWTLIVAAVLVVGCLMRLLHETRVRYVLPEGTEWTPGYVTAEAPPGELNAVRTMRRPAAMALWCTGLSLCLFVGLVLAG